MAKTDSIIRTRRAVVSSNRWARVVPPDADEPGGQFLDPLAWRDAELSRHQSTVVRMRALAITSRVFDSGQITMAARR